MPVRSLLKAIKSFARGALEHVPLGVWQRLFPKDVIALGYHIVSDEDLPHLKYYHYKNSAQFQADVAFVTERFRIVSHDEVAAHRLRGIPLPPQSFLFSFDDGFAECYDIIRPVLQKYAASGIFFVTTDFLDDSVLFFETKVSLCLAAIEQMAIDEAKERVASLGIGPGSEDHGRRERAEMRLSLARVDPPTSPPHHALMHWLLGFEQNDETEIAAACAALDVDPAAYNRRRRLYLSRDQIRQLAAEGFTIGGHGLAHLPLQRMDSGRLERELVSSCQIVRDLTGQEKVPFAFPYNGEGIDRGLLADLRRRHPFIELIFDTGGLRREAPFIIDRIWADPPPKAGGLRSSLPELLRRSWSHKQAWFQATPAHPAFPDNVAVPRTMEPRRPVRRDHG